MDTREINKAREIDRERENNIERERREGERVTVANICLPVETPSLFMIGCLVATSCVLLRVCDVLQKHTLIHLPRCNLQAELRLHAHSPMVLVVLVILHF